MSEPEHNLDGNRSKRRRFQFGLRGLIVLITIVSPGLGWFAVRFRQAERQRTAVAAIVAAGGTVEYDYQHQVDESGEWIPVKDPPEPDWLREWLGKDFFTRAYSVTFFHQTDLTDDQLFPIAVLDQLSEVVIIEGRISDDGLDVIRTLSKLKRLRLCDVAITDAGLAALEPLESLESLDLGGTLVTDRGLAKLSGFQGLRHLDLQRTLITNRGMTHLAAFPKLGVLNISVNEIGDAGVSPLLQLKQLRLLTLGGTRVTADGVKQLRQSLPDCQITWWQRKD